ncbi:MAG: hypothetical protein ACWGMZ_12175, partial [Thermoguttaceae bacterium]
AWSCYRFLARLALTRYSDIELAVKLQSRFPALGDRLTNAVDFATQPENDETAGLADLRQAVIARAEAEIAELNFNQALDTRPTQRAALLLCLFCTVAIILALIAPEGSRTALIRLLNPLSRVEWPPAEADLAPAGDTVKHSGKTQQNNKKSSEETAKKTPPQDDKQRDARKKMRLKKILAQITQWEVLARFERDFRRLLAAQKQTAQRTAELGQHTLGKPVGDLSAEQTADLKMLAERQSDHAQVIKKVSGTFFSSAGNKLLATMLPDPFLLLRQMESCAACLRENQIGRAAGLQKIVLKKLQGILDILEQLLGRSSIDEKLALLEQTLNYDRQGRETAQTAEAGAGQNDYSPSNHIQDTVDLAALKLVKLLQQEINQRTSRLAAQLGPEGKPSARQRREFKKMAAQQSRLAELILKMTNQ